MNLHRLGIKEVTGHHLALQPSEPGKKENEGTPGLEMLVTCFLFSFLIGKLRTYLLTNKQTNKLKQKIHKAILPF